MVVTIDKYAEVILPLAVPNTFTYEIPEQLYGQVVKGQSVIVNFGKQKQYSAIVCETHNKAPKHYKAKVIEDLVDGYPIVLHQQLDFWSWIAAYYMCTKGEVLLAALPSQLRLSSETIVMLNDSKKPGEIEEDEELIVKALLARNVLSMDEIIEIIPKKKAIKIVKSLIEKERISIQETIKSRYFEKVSEWVELNSGYLEEEAMRELMDQLQAKAPKQFDVLMKYIQISRVLSDYPKPVKKLDLAKVSGAGSSPILAMVKKGIFNIEKRKEGRLKDVQGEKKFDLTLSALQEKKSIEIDKIHEEKEVVLLHGVTSSGKTEIYIRKIERQISSGKQVLYLVPEIALTTQLIQRLRNYFGKKVGVYHSRFNLNERTELWKDMIHKKFHDYEIIIGARSAIFLPFNNLGLVIIDEEHDSSFKQYDPAPRYHARDAAIYLANMHGAKVILGSATPSIESYQNAIKGKYGLVELNERFGEQDLPEVKCVDLKPAYKKKKMKAEFSPELFGEIDVALKKGKQVILFQNRRGYSPLWQCTTCGWVPQCIRCDVSLTYHKYAHQLKCHYCGYSLPADQSCGECGSNTLKMIGFGTEKIEDDLRVYFPEARTTRLDLDTTRKKGSFEKIISDFEMGVTNVLVGTQMVTKGLDFDNVALVGILHADRLLNWPDFRAYERAYQLMSQVAGRSGRKGETGKVIIQTFQPDHNIIAQVIGHDYQALFRTEIAERKKYAYPPFHRLIGLSLRHRNRNLLDETAKVFAENLIKKFGSRVLGPEYPLVSRIRNIYHKNILLKIERNESFGNAKALLKKEVDQMKQSVSYKSVRIVIDVDPY